MAKQKILVIDDEVDINRLIVELLNDEGFSAESAFDGEEGLKKIKEFKPDLILLDWQLPDMEGVDVLRILRTDMGIIDIPVIMCTSLGSQDHKIKGLETGADDYITKPFNSGELLARVKVHLRRLQREEKIIETRIAQLQKYLPKEMLEKLLSAPKIAEGERRIVTILFADLTGFTSMAEEMDPEDVKKIVNDCFKELVDVISIYGGTIDKFIGDAIMALFGAPLTHEDDAIRAVKSALVMLYKLNEFNKSHPELPKKLQMRIGINTGEVVAGSMGSDAKMEYTVMGDAVNTTSRLQTAAQPNQIIISEDTFNYVKGNFILNRLEPVTVKGKKEPINIYEVKGVKYSRFEFNIINGKISDYVVPEREFNFIKNFIDRMKIASNGYCVSLFGHYGVGKSRLFYELSKYIEDLNVKFFEFKCLPYGPHGNTIIIFDVQNKKFINSGIKQIIVEHLKISPVILFIEDIHYATETSINFLDSIIDFCAIKPLLVISNSLPATVLPWQNKTYYREIELPTLTEEKTQKMINNLLADLPVLEKIKNLLVFNSDGVPLFIEALVEHIRNILLLPTQESKKLLEQVDDLDIPPKIYIAVMSQVDQLDVKTKEVLQIASVIGINFGYKTLKYLYPDETTIKESLNKLIKKQIIQEKALLPERIYSFKLKLFQKVIYNTLLFSTRKELQEKISKMSS